MVIIPYFFLIVSCYYGTKFVTNDTTTALYTLVIGINAVFCLARAYLPITQQVIEHMLGMIAAYYVFDIHHQIATNQPDKWMYVNHHVVTLQLILTHSNHMLPVSVGIGFLTLFEYSNTFLQIFQLCHKKGWKTARSFVSIPFVLTYVPLRLVAIPLKSLQYIPYIMSYSLLTKVYLLSLLAFVDVFSMYFAVTIAKKSYKHFVKKESL
jgi:CDP-diglyceride synthetase